MFVSFVDWKASSINEEVFDFKKGNVSQTLTSVWKSSANKYSSDISNFVEADSTVYMK